MKTAMSLQRTYRRAFPYKSQQRLFLVDLWINRYLQMLNAKRLSLFLPGCWRSTDNPLCPGARPGRDAVMRFPSVTGAGKGWSCFGSAGSDCRSDPNRSRSCAPPRCPHAAMLPPADSEGSRHSWGNCIPETQARHRQLCCAFWGPWPQRHL